MIKLLTKFLKIRTKQLNTEFKNLGFIYSIFALLLFVFLLYVSNVKSNSFNDCAIICTLLICVLIVIHYSRNDHQFIQIITDKKWLITNVEYLIISLPWLIIFISHLQILIVLLLIAACFLISLIKIKKTSTSSKVISLSFIPIILFEWRAGIRKPLILFLILYIFSWLLLGVSFVSLLMIWILSGIIFGCYQYCEPLEILQLTLSENASIYSTKILPAFQYLSIITLPQLIIYSIIHTDQWLIPLVEFLLLSVVLCFTIISKYAFYTPNEENSPIKIYLALAQISIIIPFLVPLPLVLSILWYSKANKKIQFYTHDSN